MPNPLPPPGRPTLLSLTALNLGADSPVPDILDDNIVHCPEAQLFPAEIIDGTSYPALVRTGYPTAQFRQYNQGVAPSDATYRTAEVQTGIVDTRIEVDKRYADGYRKGPSAWQTIKAGEQAVAILRLIGFQTYYGKQNDPNGFPGFWELYDPTLAIDLQGAVQADGFRTSVWAVKVGELDVKHVYGNKKTLDLQGNWREESIVPDPTQPTKKIAGYVNYWGGHPGLQVLSKNSIALLKNVTNDPNHPISMNVLRLLLEKFPVGVVPDYIMMTRAARANLRQSLITALIPDPPTPTNVDDVPIVVTDSISNAELAVYV